MRKSRRTRYLGDIRTHRELRQAQREIDLELWYTGERLADDFADTFSLDNLISIIAPPGSLTARLIGGVGSGLATVRGIIAALGVFRGRRC